MKFFVPLATEPHQHELFYSEMKAVLAETTGSRATHRRYRTIVWRHDGATYSATVGERTSFPGSPGVVQIIVGSATSSLFFVCTTGRGIAAGQELPIHIGISSVVTVELFDTVAPTYTVVAPIPDPNKFAAEEQRVRVNLGSEEPIDGRSEFDVVFRISISNVEKREGWIVPIGADPKADPRAGLFGHIAPDVTDGNYLMDDALKAAAANLVAKYRASRRG